MLMLTCGGFCGYKLIKYELAQSKEIQSLQNQVNLINAELDEIEVSWFENGFNYLAIGNSITIHGYADYWWDDDRGMAASTDDNDYVHIVSKWLEDRKKNKESGNEEVKYYGYNFSTWEVQSNDRAETLSLLNSYLSFNLDLITIQLSENASNIDTFEADCEELYRYVKDKAPNAQIIIIDDFWDAGDKSNMKKQAAKASGLDFVSLDDIKGKSEYQAGIGTVVEDKEGNKHTIEHAGVALHPNDQGMQYIADKIIEFL